MAKSRGIVPVIVILAVIVIGGVFWVKGRYNNLVGMDEKVKTAWGQVENQYQRRADLIPNLVNTVKGYAAHERGTLESVINARANATRTNIDPSNMTEADLQRFQAQQGELSSALSRLMVVVERYPELKANENFKELQAQLEGTENRIAVERKRFNETAQEYNTYVRSFPTNLLAGMFGFQQKPYFAAAAGSENAPTVDFGTGDLTVPAGQSQTSPGQLAPAGGTISAPVQTAPAIPADQWDQPAQLAEPSRFNQPGHSDQPGQQLDGLMPGDALNEGSAR